MLNTRFATFSWLVLVVEAKYFFAPNTLSNTTTVAESVSVSAGALDEPKLSPLAANSSSYDWLVLAPHPVAASRSCIIRSRLTSPAYAGGISMLHRRRLTIHWLCYSTTRDLMGSSTNILVARFQSPSTVFSPTARVMASLSLRQGACH